MLKINLNELRKYKVLRIEEDYYQHNYRDDEHESFPLYTESTTKATTKPLGMSVVETNTNTLLTTEKSNTLDYLSSNIDILMDMIEKYS